jgi:isoleucyl-tRNA synthetase
VPIPVFIHRETQELHPETPQIIKKVAELVEQKGINAWFDLDIVVMLGDDSKDYIKVMDTLDVWFDSGVTHDTVLHNDKRLDYPADLYLEGSDQHRGWFQSSLLTSLAITENEKPYRSVVTHGFTVDANGMKMSKSKGNVIAPQKVMNVYGADILRLWVAATDYRTEMNVSDEILKRIADAYRRIRNTSRYLLSNLNDFDPKKNTVNFSDMLDLDKWVFEHTVRLQKEIIIAYDNLEFHLIYQLLHQFCVVEMGGFYLDIIKDRQYTTGKDSLIRRSGQTAMYHLIQMLVRWLAPVMSYTADEIWKYIPGDKDISVFLEDWYEIETEDIDSKSRKFRWETIISVRDEVNKQLEKLRADGTIGSSLDAEVNIYCNGEFFSELNYIEDELRFVLISSSAHIYPLDKRIDDAIKSDIPNLFIYAKPHAYKKCVRCWHRHESIGKNDLHKELCSRCIKNISKDGEIRLYA